ncbi:PQQ-dependent sugar dehydrogenase [Methylogaea oryzae]|uniref:Sorbosone dehydrogenase n=2 Tax=Methylogaea oryzae TaxID=1295382 RepID=A0A8D4VRM4_9GAMM|nr:PQQ-dependent sugar dehydrogenase [Methylogaea oryzae]BBL72002.1 sorbosone dehydrogenase [Methylogaea oryzae]
MAMLLAFAWIAPATAAHLDGEVIVGGDAAVERAVLPKGFRLSLYTGQTPEARSLALGDDGTVYVGSRELGKVYAVRDTDGDGRGDQVTVIASGLNLPNGVAFYQGALYVAEVHRIIRFDRIASRLDHPPRPAVVYDGLPRDALHGSRYLRVGPDGKLYLGIGVPCNVCQPAREIYGTLARLNRDGSRFEIVARGIRNTVGFDWQPGTGQLYFTDNGRDLLGDDSPPEELNRLDRPGLHFGFPHCHGGDVADPQFGKEQACDGFAAPVWRFPAHVAPLGMRFYTGKQFPAEYREQLFVAQHGSWNRSTPLGYRVVLVRFEKNQPVADQVFIDGWLTPNGKVLARPVDILQMPDGSLLVSDEMNGALYRISYAD